ncbi:MAG: CopG family ribbon-helix-helix protein [Candidatus Bilamarchaeum sp.]|jgi:CopG family nickel-responsive transcriptional regulator
MPIISISLNEKILEEIDRVREEFGFSGRSEVIRAGVRSLVAEDEQRKKLSGDIKSVLLIVHNEEAEAAINEIKHHHEDVIDTQIHTNLKEGKCLEIFVLSGKAEKIRELAKASETNKKVDYVKLIVP